MSAPLISILLLAVCTAFCQAAHLRIISADIADPWIPGPVLSGAVSVCPWLLFDKFTVECVPDSFSTSTAAWAKFSLNDTFYHREFVGPFVLTGRFLSDPLPWEQYSARDFVPSTTSIKCLLSNDEEVTATVSFICTPEAVALAPLPAADPEPIAAPTMNYPLPSPETSA